MNSTPFSQLPTASDPVGASDPVSAAATMAFGIRYLYPWQRLVIANILDAAAAEEAKCSGSAAIAPEDRYDEDGALRGRQIVLLPTGAGKSLCFQVPALFLNGPTLIIYPLLALMNDQLRRMDECAQTAVMLRGGQSAAEREELFRKIEGRDGRTTARFIIANPEILAAPGILERLALCHIAHLAIDEAHCVSEWGDSFRPGYLELGKVVERLSPPIVTAFTATASPAVLRRTAEVLFGGEAHLVRGEADRPNIRYTVIPCYAKEAALVRTVARAQRPLVVFCSSRGGTERSAAVLRAILNDSDIRFYHAGLTREEKNEVEKWFHAHQRAVLTATCAWGLGVDKKDVRTVIHRDPPPTAESYIQEAGRGGRDGQPAEAILLWSPADSRRLTLLPPLQRSRAQVLLRFASGERCRREILLEALGDERCSELKNDGQGIACSGCDVCEGTALKNAPDAELAEQFIKGNRRAWRRHDAAHYLAARGNTIMGGNERLRLWKDTDFLEIFSELEKEGRIRERKHWPWRQLLDRA